MTPNPLAQSLRDTHATARPDTAAAQAQTRATVDAVTAASKARVPAQSQLLLAGVPWMTRLATGDPTALADLPGWDDTPEGVRNLLMAMAGQLAALGIASGATYTMVTNDPTVAGAVAQATQTPGPDEP